MERSKNPLRNAIAYLRSHKWIKDALHSGDATNPSGVCALGALYYGNGWNGVGSIEFLEERETLRDAELLLTQTIRQEVNTLICTVPEWNDDFAENPDQVIEMFKKAAENWDIAHEEKS